MHSNIPSKRIGKTALHIPLLGCGGASLGGLYQPISDEAAGETVRAALNAGLRYFDTAPYYGFGLSERRLGDLLRHEARDSYVLSTKVGRLLTPCGEVDASTPRHGFCSPMPFAPLYDYSYDGIMRSHEHSLQRLGLSRVDILYVHDIGERTHGAENAQHLKALTDSGYKALDELRSAGQISAVGLGVNECRVCEAAMQYGDYDCFLLAGRYTLLEQDALDSLLPECERRGVSIIIGGVYNSGILATGTASNAPLYYNYVPAAPAIIQRVQAIEALCQAFALPLAAAALQFPLHHPAVAGLIPGLSRPKHIRQTLDCLNTAIPAEFWQALVANGLLRADAPVPGAMQQGAL